MPFLVVTRRCLQIYAAVFVLGLVLGSTTTLLYSGHQIDEAYIQLETLHSELGEHQRRMTRLESSLTERRKRVVQSIAIELNITDPHVAIKVKEVIRDLLDETIGREVSTLDPKLVAGIINNRIIDVAGQVYALRLELLALSETLYVYVDVDLRAHR